MALSLPDYWLHRPALPRTEELRAAFDDLLDRAIAAGPAQPIDYRLSAPRWQFLCYASEERGLALHGSLNPTIDRFAPRKANDLRDFGDQTAIYAASDGIWPMYFAIVDRVRYPTTLINACIRLESPEGQISPPLYFFSVSRTALAQRPWTDGFVYLLPRETFTAEQPFSFGDYKVHTTQLASLEPVTPLAKLAVGPADFPFLAEMRAHDDDRLEEYANALNRGQPWPGENKRSAA